MVAMNKPNVVAGVPVWDALSQYPAGAVVYHVGYFWAAIKPSVGERPDTRSFAWEMSAHPSVAPLVTYLTSDAQVLP